LSVSYLKTLPVTRHFGHGYQWILRVALADTVIERHRQRLKRKAKRITIDLDPTDDPTHGAQQLTFRSSCLHSGSFIFRTSAR